MCPRLTSKKRYHKFRHQLDGAKSRLFNVVNRPVRRLRRKIAVERSAATDAPGLTARTLFSKT